MPAPGVLDSELLDLAASTLKDLGRFRITNIAQSLQKFTAVPDLIKKDKVKFAGGTGITRNVMTSFRNAQKTRLFADDQINVDSHLAKVTIGWSRMTQSYAWDKGELLENKGDGQKIVDLLMVRRNAAMLGIFQYFEDAMWTLPSTYAEDNIMGIPNWVVKNASEGFTGGAPSGSGYTHPGGLDHANYKNWSAAYSNITADDALKLLRKMKRQTDFLSPIDMRDYRDGAGKRYEYFTNDAVIDEMEQLLVAQNDNLGTDLWKYDGATTFGRNRVTRVPKLNADTQNPIYQIDRATLYPVFLEGAWMAESAPAYLAGKHTTMGVFVDCTVNVICDDRRANGVIFVNS